VNNNY